MLRSVRFLLWLPALLLAGAPGPAVAAPAAPPDHPVVPGFERFFTADKADGARGGRLLLTELNCVRCHEPATPPALPKQGPVLDGVGARVRAGWIKKFLADPQAAKPGTTMPHLLASDPQKDEKVEALTHFLVSTGPLRHGRPDGKLVAAGRDLYHKAGCVACHGTRTATGEAEKVLPDSVPLGDLKAKYSLAGLTAFLTDPLHARPSGRMPKLLDAKEAQAVANYLLQGIKVPLLGKGSANYSYYEGSWQKLPNFSKLRPKATGTAPGFDVSVAQRNSDFALVFDAFFKVDQDGTYTFILTSDDGSKLYVDGKQVVDNDGIHPAATKEGSVKLTRGVHKVSVALFQGGGEVVLDAQIDGPGLGRQPLGDLSAAREADLAKKPTIKGEDDFEVQPSLIERGKVLFGSLGCASCHTLNADKKPIVSSLKAQPLAKLSADRGCLSPTPVKGAPFYRLSTAQRRSLDAALKEKAPPATPADLVATTLTTFNCYACHVRDKVGGPQEELNKFFQTTQPEMGDEGRVPPPLDGVGAKLRPEYLAQILDSGAHDRKNYMHTHMPGFGRANVGHLVNLFGALDRLPTPPVGPVTFKETPSKVKSQARHLVGGTAFGCIKCHTFAGHKAEGVQGIDMTLMTKRLKRDWFHAYVADPQRIRPGTRMPSAFSDGMSVLPNILDGTARTQIEAMWVYLSDGTSARLPVGLGKASIPLMPTGGAILYRNFIEGAGTRAIGVGYPEKAHLAFDANELRIALLWKGAFMDAARHWTDRGAGSEGPLGDDVLKLPAGVPFAVLAKPGDPWPTGTARAAGLRFRGYRLTPDDRPTFLYALGDVQIEDFPAPVPGGKDVTLRRTFHLSAAKPAGEIYYRAAAGNKIEAQPGGWFTVDGTWKVKVQDAKASVRKSGGKDELVVPVPLKDGKGGFVVEYAW